MAVHLGSNIAALRAQSSLNEVSHGISRTYERLSSGMRINRAADDAAGLSISSSLSASSRVYTQAIRNIGDGVSALSIAEGTLNQLTDISIRQRELATQSSNGVYSLKQRRALNSEANALVDEFNRLVESVDFNGLKLLSGDISDIRVQTGFGTNGSIYFRITQELARNVGTGGFDPAVGYTTGYNNNNDVALADFNGDGTLDYVSAGSGANSVSVMLGNGNGTFKAAVSYATGGVVADVSAADLNGDGKQDLVLSSSAIGGTLRVMMGAGDGSFQTAVSYSIGTTVSSHQVADVNNDGVFDIIAASSGLASIFIGNGDGTFQSRSTVSLGVAAAGMINLVDVDNDSYLDIVTARNGVYSVVRGAGNGSFSAGISTALATVSNFGFEAGDFNGDGIADLVNSDGSVLNILLGNGDGTFKVSNTYGVTGDQITLGDMNGDGLTDLMTFSSSSAGIQVHFGVGDGTFKASGSATATGNVVALVAADIDADGANDLVTGTTGAATGSILIADTDRVSTIGYFNLNTRAGALSAIGTIDATMRRISGELGGLGSTQRRLEVALRSIEASRENFMAANGRIVNADIAQESADLVRQQVLQQGVAAVLAQANQLPALALKLLK